MVHSSHDISTPYNLCTTIYPSSAYSLWCHVEMRMIKYLVVWGKLLGRSLHKWMSIEIRFINNSQPIWRRWYGSVLLYTYISVSWRFSTIQYKRRYIDNPVCRRHIRNVIGDNLSSDSTLLFDTSTLTPLDSAVSQILHVDCIDALYPLICYRFTRVRCSYDC